MYLCILFLLPLFLCNPIINPEATDRWHQQNNLYGTEYSLMDSALGNLNLDGYEDKILILKHASEGMATDVPRPLLILLGTEGGEYILAARNDSSVLCADHGGVAGDPYQNVTINKGGFSVNHYGGSGWRWTRNIQFRFSKKQNDWILQHDGGLSYHLSEPDKTEEYTRNPSSFELTSFRDYRNGVL